MFLRKYGNIDTYLFVNEQGQILVGAPQDSNNYLMTYSEEYGYNAVEDESETPYFSVWSQLTEDWGTEQWGAFEFNTQVSIGSGFGAIGTVAAKDGKEALIVTIAYDPDGAVNPVPSIFSE